METYVEHGAIQIAEDAPVNTDDFLADRDDDGDGATPDVGETGYIAPPPAPLNPAPPVVRLEHRLFEPRQYLFTDPLRADATGTPTSF